MGKIGRKDMMPLTPIIVVDVVDVRGIDFMGLFPNSFENEYILLCVDSVSKWVEAIRTRTNESKVVVIFLRENIFASHGMPKDIISDQETHFDNRFFDALLNRYSILHCMATPYRLQTNGQVEVSYR